MIIIIIITIIIIRSQFGSRLKERAMRSRRDPCSKNTLDEKHGY